MYVCECERVCMYAGVCEHALTVQYTFLHVFVCSHLYVLIVCMSINRCIDLK